MIYFKKILYVLTLLLLFSLLPFSKAESAAITKKEFYDGTSNALHVPILYFHRVHPDLDKYPNLKKIAMTPQHFETILKDLKANGYTTISQEQFIAYYAGTGLVPAKSVLLTIDDGFKDIYTYAFPLLKKYKMKAVVFPITSDVEKGIRFNAPMMTYEDMREMLDSRLIELGNHTHDLHWRSNGYKAGFEAMIYNRDKNGQLIPNRYRYIHADAVLAANKLREQTDAKIDSICYPYGAYDQLAINVYKDLQYRVGYTIKEGLNLFGGGIDNPLEANRIGVYYGTSSASIMQKLANYQTEAKNWTNKNKDIQTKVSNYSNIAGMTINVKSLADAKSKTNTVKEYHFEVHKNIQDARVYVGPATTATIAVSDQSNVKFNESFSAHTYSKTGAGNYSMKVTMLRKDGSQEIEWINYKVSK